jgi:hypothetical protein
MKEMKLPTENPSRNRNLCRRCPDSALRFQFSFFNLLLMLGCTGLTGCTGFWDEITSRDFSVKNFFVTPNPMLVLRDSSDGDLRARSLRALREPKLHGGTDADQDAVVKILCTAAATEKQPLCRLAAIQSLGRFKDPRAVEGLKDAFYNASSFAPETTTIIRCQAVTALGQTGNPGGLELLTRVVGEPPAEGSEMEKQQALDVRIAAARALCKFKEPAAAQALVHVLQTERDVGLRDRATESLQLATGKNLPADAKAWEQALQPAAGTTVAAEQGKRIKLLGWFGG